MAGSAHGAQVPPAAIASALRRAGAGELSDTALRRALYTSDASLYRVLPAVVAWPRDAGEVAAALSASRRLGVPLTCRGAGTSIAGNAVGTGRDPGFLPEHLVDREPRPRGRCRRVQPGVVQAQLQARQPRARAAVRPGSVDAGPVHDRRHDRQRLVRLTVAALRPYLGQRAGPGRADGRRRGRLG